ncbi:MAG: methyl-accepting chemotaxis protein [ANME-2 cluster archaeon]|nr:methyl-accepting chemotaxis protein [ANME-2 cluster archaeon]
MTLQDTVNNMPIGRKLFAGFGIVVLFFIIIGYVGVNGFNMAGTNMEIIANTHAELLKESSSMEIAMLQARRSEKDFFARLDTSYIAKVNTQVDTIVEDAQSIQQLDITNRQREDAKEIESLVKEYRVLFNEVTDLHIQRGLTVDSGILGDARTATHEVETLIAEQNADGSINQLLVDMLQMRRDEKDYLARSDIKYQTQLHDTQKLFLQHLDDTDLSQTDKDQMRNLLNTYVVEFDKIVKIDAQIASKTAQFTDKTHQIEPLVEALQAEAVVGIDGETAQAIDEMAASSTNMVVLSIIALIIAVLAAFVITRSITKPVNEMVDIAKRISKGDLSVEITNTSKDEIGALAQALAEMKNVILSVVSDINTLVDATLDGKLDARANASNYQGDFADIIMGMNNTLDAVVGPLNMAAEYIDRISKGDIPEKITDVYKGDFNEIKNNINICIDAIKEMVSDITTLSEAVEGGKMNKRADSSKHKGDYKMIVQGMNDTLNAVAEPFKIASEVAMKLASAAQQLASSSQEMNATTEQVASTVQQIAKGTQSQSIQVGNTSRTMEGMAEIVKEVALKSQSAADISINASKIAQEGSDAAGNAAVKMSDIQKVVSESADVVKELGGRSQEIGEIVEMITGIANQTNLLALNAAIEAARAGEAGRGFAVVADEVRNLAEESKQAANKIAVLIKEIQSETDKAVTSMESGTTEVEEGSKIVNEALAALENIAAGSQEVANVIQEISAASEMQQMGIQNVVKAIDEIAAVAEEAAAGTEEASGATEEQTASMEEITSQAQELANMGVELQKALERFTLTSAG